MTYTDQSEALDPILVSTPLSDGKRKVLTFGEGTFFGSLITAIHLSLGERRELTLNGDISVESFSGDS